MNDFSSTSLSPPGSHRWWYFGLPALQSKKILIYNVLIYQGWLKLSTIPGK